MICSTCHLDLSPEDFHVATQRKNGRQSRCKSCRKAFDAQRYQEDPSHRAALRERSQAMAERNRRHVQAVMAASAGCVDCGNTDRRVLEFDHVRGVKEGHVSRMANRGISLARLEAEIAKCEIRCANCHRIVTYERRRLGTAI